ncbi:hypothetical protein, variant [Capsaspora owczarzaki ATCC 30864]|uniref:P2X receptor n=1 Tax=Capsaspora owczarzaki (strain ATCC 30864) TaxID=595528 RepID=A0A0D2WIR0_CAPO3|nr:hypothetical protein, variant [Capsaspora owczarzaki ATCC 30864]
MASVVAAFKRFIATDPDLLFNYKTQRIVRINDRRLGLIYYAFMLAILGYVIGYTIIYNKRYLLLDDSPTGSVRMSLAKPTKVNSNQPYCLQNQPTVNDYTNYMCNYYDDLLVVYPRTEQTALLAASRITIQNNTLNCDFAADPNCDFTPETPTIVYVGDIEHFTLMIDHTTYSTNLDIQANAQSLEGKLLDLHGNTMKLTGPNVVGQIGQLDIFELQTLLLAAGIATLDQDSGALNTKTNNSSLRYTGLVLLVLIEYDNVHSFDTSDIRYTISVRSVKNTQFKSVETRTSTTDQSLQTWDRHGIRILIQQKGQMGKFDFQTLLINVVSGFGLLAVATLVVDVLAVSVMPEREIYSKYKYDDTLDFSDIRDGITKAEDDQLISIKTRKSAAQLVGVLDSASQPLLDESSTV